MIYCICSPLQQLSIYDSFDDCLFAKHCSISVFEISRPTDLQNLWKHFHILKFKKSLNGIIIFGLPGGTCALPPPLVKPLIPVVCMCVRLSLRLVSVLRMATRQQNASRTVYLTTLSFIMTPRRASTWSSNLQSFTISFCIALRSTEPDLVA